MPVKQVVKLSLGKSRLLDRDVNHTTFFLCLSEEEESEDSPAGQTWLSLTRLKELAQQVCSSSYFGYSDTVPSNDDHNNSS